jgi:hypothetical protein
MNNKVSIGTTTVAGWGTALAAFITAGITYLTGDHTAQTITALELAGIGVVSGGITQVFRYLQAHKLIPKSESYEHISNEILSKEPSQLISEGKKIIGDVEGVIKDPASVLDIKQDEEIASDIDTLATGTPSDIPDGDNSKVVPVAPTQAPS